MNHTMKKILLACATATTLGAVSLPAMASYTVTRTTTYYDNGYPVAHRYYYHDGRRYYYDDGRRYYVNDDRDNGDGDGDAVAGLAVGALAGAAIMGIATQDRGGHWHHHHPHHHHHCGRGGCWG